MSFWRLETFPARRIYAVTALSAVEAIELLRQRGIEEPGIIELVKDYRPPDRHTFVAVEVVQ